jgi:hypothetical protein
MMASREAAARRSFVESSLARTVSGKSRTTLTAKVL